MSRASAKKEPKEDRVRAESIGLSDLIRSAPFALACDDLRNVPRVVYKNRPKPGQKLTRTRVARALAANGGNITATAKMLGVATTTIADYLNVHYPELADFRLALIEGIADIAESRLFDMIDAGEFAAVKFFLETRARHRGYAKQVAVTGKDEGPVNVSMTFKQELTTKLQTMLERAAVPGDVS